MSTEPGAASDGARARERPARATGNVSGAGRIRKILARGAVLLGLLVLTGLNLTYAPSLDEARKAERWGKPADAARLALDYLDHRPWSPAAARLAARSFSRLDHPLLAEPYYRRSRSLLDQEDLHVRALGLVRSNRRKEAVEAYREILENQPDDPKALQRLSAEFMSQSRWDEALEYARRLAATPEGQIHGLALIGAIEHERENPELSVAAYLRILELDPALQRLPSEPSYRKVFWSLLAQGLLTIGRPREAREYLERGVAEVADPTLRWLLGQAYDQEGRTDEAERVWRDLVRDHPEQGLAWTELGRLALSRSEPEEAVEALTHAENLLPDSSRVPYLLSLAYSRLGMAAEAEAAGRRAERLRKAAGPPSGGMGAMPSGSSPSRSKPPAGGSPPPPDR